ncbi:MAG: fibrobacter succinogenes major paralogous domain-containing protein [Bacteroidales bacterium]|nr:fibrobacter succinogenes major paralogous domain-containing protein [Bacteroidales bacterium]MCL2132812.1 fibrobacter succinogenes major paralogous domain-containing protein [Bacteroidales bacterium]
MKKIIITLFAIMCLTAVFGQEKTKLAVYVHGDAREAEKKVVGARIISTIVKSDKYAAVERTADFLAELSREQGYQYSGSVDDGQIIKLGKQFGVKMVCVADVGGSDLFARMIDIETGLVASVSGRHGVSLSNLDNLISNANALIENLLQNVTTTVDKQKIAIYVTKSSDSYKAKRVNYQLIENITNTGVFITVDRTSDFLAELKYQGSGNVDDRQLSRLGKQFGVNLVCVIDITSIGNDTYTTVRIINVETGMIIATSEKKGWNSYRVSSDHRNEQYVTWSGEYSYYSETWENYYYLNVFNKNLDEITAELMQQLGVYVCIKKDQRKSQFECCTGLTEYDGFCRDFSGGMAAYWVKHDLGVEVMYKDITVTGKDVKNKKNALCPVGWRLPTSAEFKKMDKVKGFNINQNRYITFDSRAKGRYIQRSSSGSYYYYYKVQVGEDYRVRCVKD